MENPLSMGLQQVADQHHTVQHNPKQEISRAFIAFFSYLVRPNNQVSEIDFRETATMTDLAITLALMTLK